MKEKERKKLLKELNEIEMLLEVRDCKHSFIPVLTLLKEDLPQYKIAERLGISHMIVSSIIHGSITFPRSLIKKIKSLGYTVCRCCKMRIVPPNNPKLSILCAQCFTKGGDIDTGIEHKMNIKIGEENEKDIVRTYKAC